MTYEERKALRMSLLTELYHYHFQHGRSKQVSLHELNEDIELKLAYQYLADKQLITMHSSNGTLYHYKITANGIDLTEGSSL